MLVLFLLAVLASALFSGLETGLYTTSRLRLHLDAQGGVRAAARARALLEDMPTLLTVLLVANNAANQAATLLAQLVLVGWGVQEPELVGTVGVSATLFLLAESVPKNAFHRARERLLYPTLPVLSAAHALLRWPTWPLTAVARWLARVAERRQQGTPEAGGHAVLRAGAREGFLTAFQERVARGVLAMRSRRAADEALPLAAFPTTRAGVPGITRPEGSREHRVLVLDSGGERVVGWMPAAALYTAEGPRAVRRRETRPLVEISPETGLDRVYVQLDRVGAPFAVVRVGDEVRVLGLNRLRERVMGTFEVAAADDPPADPAPAAHS